MGLGVNGSPAAVILVIRGATTPLFYSARFHKNKRFSQKKIVVYTTINKWLIINIIKLNYMLDLSI